MAAAFDHELQRVDHLRAHVVAIERERREAGRYVEDRERLGGELDRRADRRDRRGQALENIEFDGERPVGGRSDLRLEVAKLRGGEAHLAGKRLAVNEKG